MCRVQQLHVGCYKWICGNESAEQLSSTPHVVAVLLHGDGLHGVRLRTKEPGGAPALEGGQLTAHMVRQLVCLRTWVGVNAPGICFLLGRTVTARWTATAYAGFRGMHEVACSTFSAYGSSRLRDVTRNREESLAAAVRLGHLRSSILGSTSGMTATAFSARLSALACSTALSSSISVAGAAPAMLSSPLSSPLAAGAPACRLSCMAVCSEASAPLGAAPLLSSVDCSMCSSRSGRRSATACACTMPYHQPLQGVAGRTLGPHTGWHVPR